jgi:hypothetical protein
VDQSANPPGPADLTEPDGARRESTEGGTSSTAPGPQAPDVEARVRDRLALLGDVGPMPDEVTERIAAALAEESRLRVARGPLAGQDADADVLAPLIRSRQRPRPWLAAAAVAAAAAVVGVGASALHLHKDASPAAALGAGPTVSGQASGAATSMHIQLSDTDYRPGMLPAEVRSAMSHPHTPLHALQAEAPALGPIAAPTGLQSCLEALGEFPPYTVLADLATYDGHPAAVLAVTRQGSTTAYVVKRTCQPGNAQILRDATPIP